MPRKDELPAREDPDTPDTCTGNGGNGGGSRRTALSVKESPDEDDKKRRHFSREPRFPLGLKEAFIDSLRRLKRRFAP